MGATIAIIIFVILTAITAAVAMKANREMKAIEAEKATQQDRYYGSDDLAVAKGFRLGGRIAAGFLGVFTALLILTSCITVVSATEVGVPVAFGKVRTPMTSGVHVKMPWVSVKTYPTRPVTVELAGDDMILARTADAGQMKVEVAARWRVQPNMAKDLYLQVRHGDDGRISDEIVTKNLRQAVNAVYAKTANLDALNDRDKVTETIRKQLNRQLRVYGVTIEDINLRSVEPDERTAEVISQYARQQQATRIAEEAKKTAEIEAERRQIEAEGLRIASSQFSGITAAEAAILCQQAWERQAQAAIGAKVPMYTSPCGSSPVGVVVPSS